MPKFVMLPTTTGDLSDAGQGRYIVKSSQGLQTLCQGIDVPEIGLATKSIPDVWGQPLRFQQALFSKDPSARMQWRGMLAMFVLRHELRLETRLLLRPIFPNASVAQPSAFLEVARKLLPDRLTEVPLGWETVHLLQFDRHTLGCTSPLTFLCPAATAPAFDIPNCGWFKDGFFGDPIPFLVGSRLHVLKRWLLVAKASLEDTGPPQVSIAGERYPRKAHLDGVNAPSLRTELQKFEAAIDARIVQLLQPRIGFTYTPGEPQVDEGTDNAFTLDGLVQRCLQVTTRALAVRLEQQLAGSSFLLRAAEGATPARPTLLISEKFVNLPEFEDGGVEVIGGMPLNQALAEYKPGNHDRLEALELTPGRVYNARELFTQQICFAGKGNAFPGTHRFAGVEALTRNKDEAAITPILPLSQDFASHFTPKYLQENVSFSGNAQQLTVTLNIQLNPAGVSGDKFIAISRTYRGKEIRDVSIPELSIWPKYDSSTLPEWKVWYTFYDDLSEPGNRLLVSPAIASGAADSTRIVDSADTTKNIFLHQTADFPTMLFCSVAGEPAGVLLPKPAVRTQRPSVAGWKVGIDFGTSGTSIYLRAGEGKPAILTFEPHLHLVSDPASRETYGFFLPSAPENQPTQEGNVAGILSVFRDFRGAGADIEIRPMHQGHISFVDRSARKLPSSGEETGICANMKWGSTADRARAKAFLKQLCLLTALQARLGGAEKLDWVFSYPLAFSRDRADSFRQTWKESTAFARTLSGYTGKSVSTTQEAHNESVCAAAFVKQTLGADIAGGALVLDIGGGSSDISVWSNPGKATEQCLLDASVKFGGRDLFQRPLLSGQPTLLPKLVPAEDAHFVATIGPHQDETLAFSKIDSLFKRGSDKILSHLDSAREDLDVVAFRSLLLIGFEGLFFYTGMLLRHVAAKRPAEAARFDGKLPSVYVCGNGGKIFEWLGSQQMWEAKLLAAFSAGAGPQFQPVPGITRISLSAAPKAEAAYGMLIAQEVVPAEAHPIVSGEAYEYKGQPYGALDDLPFDSLDEDAFVVSRDLPELTTFLQLLGHRALPVPVRESVRLGVNNTLAEIARRRKTAIPGAHEKREEEQPIFIMELAELIRRATADWKGGKDRWWSV